MTSREARTNGIRCEAPMRYGETCARFAGHAPGRWGGGHRSRFALDNNARSHSGKGLRALLDGRTMTPKAFGPSTTQGPGWGLETPAHPASLTRLSGRSLEASDAKSHRPLFPRLLARPG